VIEESPEVRTSVIEESPEVRTSVIESDAVVMPLLVVRTEWLCEPEPPILEPLLP
jgi:hypothetical protein